MTTVNLTQDNFDDVISQNEIVLVDFWAQWCNPCLAFAKTYEKCASQYDDVVFAKINVDEQQDLASDFSIRSVPMLMVFREKIVVFAESGTMPEKALQELIEQAKSLDMAEIHKQIKMQEGDRS